MTDGIMKLKRGVYGTLLALFVALSCILLGELVVRLAGLTPWQNCQLDASEPTMHKPDAVLGWRNKAGAYIIPPYAEGGNEIHLTFTDNGRRVTQPPNSDSVARSGLVVTIGGSYTQGWAVCDEETYPWKLQLKMPKLRVLNYGTGGFGTCQSLLMLQQIFKERDSINVVVYGFIEHHILRNVATDWWLELLSALSKRGHVAVPRASLGPDGELVFHKPEGYARWPFRERSALVALLQKVFMKVKGRGRFAQGRRVTEMLLLEMQRLCSSQGAILIVVLFDGKPEVEQHYRRFLDKNRIPSISCIQGLSPDMIVPGEVHPNGKVHSLWADCVAEIIGRLRPEFLANSSDDSGGGA